MSLVYRFAADATVVAHFAYVLFVIGGLLAVAIGWLRKWQWTRGFWFRVIHLLMIGTVVVESWLGITCPLTTLEHYLRSKSGAETYQGDFIATWVHDVLFIEAEPWVFTVCYSLFGLLVLLTLILAPPRWPGRKRPTSV